MQTTTLAPSKTEGPTLKKMETLKKIKVTEEPSKRCFLKVRLLSLRCGYQHKSKPLPELKLTEAKRESPKIKMISLRFQWLQQLLPQSKKPLVKVGSYLCL